MIIVEIEGMMCEHCASKVKEALLKIDGVKSVDVNHKLGLAKIESKNDLDSTLVKKTIDSLGFKFIKID